MQETKRQLNGDFGGIVFLSELGDEKVSERKGSTGYKNNIVSTLSHNQCTLVSHEFFFLHC